MAQGWICVHRKLIEWEWYSDINVTRLFLHLLLTANHKDKNWRGILIRRGSRLTSLDKLSVEIGLSVSKIRTAIKKLILTNEIANESHSQYTVFIIKNYDTYQDNDKQIANKSQTDNKRIATNNNDNNDNNDIYQQIADEWNSIFKNDLSLVSKLTQKRKTCINGCIKQMKSTNYDFTKIETWSNLFKYVKTLDFLMGIKTDWKINFDFVINKNKLIKIIEGDYDNK